MQQAKPPWSIFFSNTMKVFSKSLLFSPNPCPLHVPIALTCWLMIQPHLVHLMSAIVHECVLCLEVQHALPDIELLLSTGYQVSFFKVRGGQCSPIWVALDSPFTIIKVWFSNQQEIETMIHSSMTKYWASVHIIGLVLGSTTEASMVQANNPLSVFLLWSSCICCQCLDWWLYGPSKLLLDIMDRALNIKFQK